VKNPGYFVAASFGFLLLIFFTCCTGGTSRNERRQEGKTGDFNIGWASADITPDEPVLLHGQRHARISEGVMDPVTATALAMESGAGPSSEKVIMISCDLAVIMDKNRDGSDNNLLEKVRKLVTGSIPELSPEQVILNATHTHSAPQCGSETGSKSYYGIELEAMSPAACQDFISERIAKAAEKAWKSRKPGGISYGLGHAVTGHNRLQADFAGRSRKRGNTNRPEFSHIEGYEDHSVNLLYTWDEKMNLTGVVINIATPAQVSGNIFQISADFWHDARLELGQRLGSDVHILPQCSAAGDQSPHLMIGLKAEERMQRLMFGDSIKTGPGSIGRRKQIALQIAGAVTSVLPYVQENVDWDPDFEHRMKKPGLSRRLIDMEDVNNAIRQAEEWKEKYDQLLQEIRENPEIKKKPRWYTEITRTYTQAKRGRSVRERYELEKRQPELSVEVHIVRIGDVVMATNPFELYLDYGMRIKARSPAVQTFLVQLAGSGSYVPASRSVEGGAYGAVPASTLIGPEGGQELVEETLDLIAQVWSVE
jgi:hypothetical protein